MKAPKLEIGVRSHALGARRKESEVRSQNKCFYKYEMLPRGRGFNPCLKAKVFAMRTEKNF
jgi:hypothetical protein